MEKLLFGFGVGLVAAAIEVLLVRTYQKNTIILAAIGCHWVSVGLLMPYIKMDVSTWLKGMVVGVLLTVPFIILDVQKSKNAVIHTMVFAPFWGNFIAYGVRYLM